MYFARSVSISVEMLTGWEKKEKDKTLSSTSKVAIYMISNQVSQTAAA